MGTSDPCSSSTPGGRGLGRRELAGLAAAAAAAPAVALLPVRDDDAATAAVPSRTRPQRLRLRPDDDVVSALDVPLTTDAGTGSRARVLPGRPVRTPVLETSRFAMLGVTWRSGRGTVRARARRTDGRWTAWRSLPVLHDRPDHGTAEGDATPNATEPVWFGASDAVQVEMTGSAREPVLSLIDPGSRDADRAPARLRRTALDTDDDTADAGDATVVTAAASTDEPTVTTVAGRRRRRVPRPPMFDREDWGANDRWRNGEPARIATIKQVHVHHTVSANDYRRTDVPALLRGMYRYHTKSLGWSDLGYNFLVDRFGRVWIGRKWSRASGPRMIQGAHTLGFNHASVGIAVMGNFEAGRPTDRVLTAVAFVAAWKLDRFDRDPLARVLMRSTGSDRYSRGQRVRLPVIDGHRDTNETACPGRHLYRQLPVIRQRAARRMRRFA